MSKVTVHCPACVHVVRAVSLEAGYQAIADHIEAAHPPAVTGRIQ